MGKLLTVIVPSYNMERYLPKCLGSLLVDDEHLLQTLEVLVVNDGSKDRTSEIAHEFESKYPGVFRVIDKTNGNYGSCVNAGLRIASGTFVKILDADDSFDSKGFLLFLRGLKEIVDGGQRVDVVVSDFVRVDEQEHEIAKVGSKLPANIVLSIESVERFDQLYMHGIAYRTQMLRDMRYSQTEGISYTDDEWACYPLLAAKTICYKPILVYRYLVGRTGQTMDFTVRKRNQWMLAKICRRMVETLRTLQVEVPPVNRAYVESFVLSSLSWLYSAAIIEMPSRALDTQLKEFDDWFEMVSPDLRERLFCSRLKSRSLGFSWARVWSRSHDSQKMLLRLYRMSIALAGWAHKVRNLVA